MNGFYLELQVLMVTGFSVATYIIGYECTRLRHRRETWSPECGRFDVYSDGFGTDHFLLWGVLIAAPCLYFYREPLSIAPMVAYCCGSFWKKTKLTMIAFLEKRKAQREHLQHSLEMALAASPPKATVDITDFGKRVVDNFVDDCLLADLTVVNARDLETGRVYLHLSKEEQ